jgi:hypothetical protein
MLPARVLAAILWCYCCWLGVEGVASEIKNFCEGQMTKIKAVQFQLPSLTKYESGYDALNDTVVPVRHAFVFAVLFIVVYICAHTFFSDAPR